MKSKRVFNIAAVNAEVRFKMAEMKFEQEFVENGNQNQRINPAPTGQSNTAEGNVPAQQVQQPVYSG